VANDDRATRNVKSPSSSARNVSTSRSFVGSSRRSTLPPLRSTLANWTRLRSPPRSRPLSSAGRCLETEARDVGAGVDLAVADHHLFLTLADLVKDRGVGLRLSRDWST